jgi:hypothetical protein
MKANSFRLGGKIGASGCWFVAAVNGISLSNSEQFSQDQQMREYLWYLARQSIWTIFFSQQLL